MSVLCLLTTSGGCKLVQKLHSEAGRAFSKPKVWSIRVTCKTNVQGLIYSK